MEFKIGDRVAVYSNLGRLVGKLVAITARYENGRREYYLDVETDGGRCLVTINFSQ
jgi:hypothetical protein